MDVTIGEVEEYLDEVKYAIKNDNYKVEMNQHRKDNNNLFMEYVINEEQRKNILLSLTPMDFCNILPNEHKGFEYERLYVFGKDVNLLQRFGAEEECVPLYIKFNKLKEQYVIVISFHKQNYPLKYRFR